MGRIHLPKASLKVIQVGKVRHMALSEVTVSQVMSDGNNQQTNMVDVASTPSKPKSDHLPHLLPFPSEYNPNLGHPISFLYSDFPR